MIIASAFNKGGVGKTTLAVHIAGILSQTEATRNLIVDCVDQADSYRFFVKNIPNHENDFKIISESLSVIWNPDRISLKKLIELPEYDNIVIDINSPAEDTVQIIADNHPGMVVLPINDQALGIYNLQTTLEVIAGMEKKAGYNMNSIIVPLGASKKNIVAAINSLSTKPQKMIMSKSIKSHRRYFSEALQTGNFVWDVNPTSCLYIRDILSGLLFKRY